MSRAQLAHLELQLPLSRPGAAQLRAESGVLQGIGALRIPEDGVEPDIRPSLAASLPALMWTPAPEEVELDLPEYARL